MLTFKVYFNPATPTVAGALMKLDEEGFLSVDEEPEAQLGAEKVMAFAKV